MVLWSTCDSPQPTYEHLFSRHAQRFGPLTLQSWQVPWDFCIKSSFVISPTESKCGQWFRKAAILLEIFSCLPSISKWGNTSWSSGVCIKHIQSAGAPGWHSLLSIWLLVSAQVIISWVMRSSRLRLCTQQGVCLKILSVFPSRLEHGCAHTLSNK